MRFFVLITFFILLSLFACQDNSENQNEPDKSHNALFTLLDTTFTGISFINRIEDLKDFNILNYRNFYNGGGVAIGDINNDGLNDVYLTANLDKNKLYLNKGQLHFEDISASAGVSGTKGFSTGVTMVDINADGWLDIYVCNSGDIAGDDKENELFINQGNGSFIEEGAKWGLNLGGYSIHAAFFDYDQDGDLDCYLLNNSFKSPDRIELYRRSRTVLDKEGGDKLLENRNGRFVDVTTEAGIYSSDLGFGLGVSISDLNGDMLPDIYISNDFWERDYLYRNLGNGKFVEELETRLSYSSLNSMGSDIGDLNNDGYPDIMTTDMLPEDDFRRKTMTQFDPYRQLLAKREAGYHFQFLQNALHFNQGNGDFKEMAYQSGVAQTDWSWGTLFFDFNNDGHKDIFVSNGILRDLTDFDFIDFIENDENVRKIAAENKRADFRDYLPFMPSTKLANYAFVNDGKSSFKNQSSSLGLGQPSFSNGSAYGDLDNDGDLDLVVNNVNMAAFVYQNQSTESGENNFLKLKFEGIAGNAFGIGATVNIYSGDLRQSYQQFLSRGFQSATATDMNIGLGKAQKVDSLTVIWPDMKKQVLANVGINSTLVVKNSEAKEIFTRKVSAGLPLFKEMIVPSLVTVSTHKENPFDDFDHEALLPFKLSTQGPKTIVSDLNGDKLDDFVILGAADQANSVYLQQRDGSFTTIFQEAIFFDQALESTCGIFLDFDEDGDNDLLIGHGGNEIDKGRSNFSLRMYSNDGHGQFQDISNQAPPAGGNLSCIEGTDIDNDGDLDLFFGGRSVPGNYGLIPASFFIINNGAGNWSKSTDREIGELGMVTAAKWSDIDGDEDKDLIVVGEWMPITIFENDNGKLSKKEEIANSHGWWQSIEASDLDGDGDEDYILGNWGENSFFNASTTHPINMYVKDFDGNGKSEFIIEQYDPSSDAYHPIASKMDLTNQLPFLKKENLSYKDFAGSNYEKMLSPTQRKGAKSFKTYTLKTSILWNEKDGFLLTELPEEVQSSPVSAIYCEDFNNDQTVDILLMGNFYGAKPEFGRQDANRGLILLGSHDKKFTTISQKESGLSIKGEVRDIDRINLTGNKEALIISRNNDSVVLITKL